MGDFFGGGLSSLFGGAGSLLGTGGTGGGGTSIDPFSTGVGAADATGAFGGYDPATASMMDYGGPNIYDPTGSLDATAAITGNYGAGANFGPAGAPSVGGTQSDQATSGTQQGTQQSSNQPAPQPAPAQPFSPPAVASSLQQAVAQGGGVNPWQPGGTPNQQVANRFGSFSAPLGMGPAVPGWLPMTQQQIIQSGAYPWNQPDAQPQTAQPPAQQPDTTPAPVAKDDQTDKPDDSAQPPAKAADATPPARGAAAPAAPPASQPGAGRGGMFNPGNILADIAGIMSGNPASLGKLVQDLMGGGPQIPGYGQPSMLPNQAGTHMMPGDPSTFGGPQYAGATPSEEPDEEQPEAQPQAPPPGRQMPAGRTPMPQEGQAYPPGYTPNRADVPPPGSAMTTDPNSLPVNRWAPARFQSNPPGQPRTYPVMRQPGQTLPPSMQRIPDSAVHPGNRPSQIGAVKPSAPPAAGPQASTPLTRQEVSVPGWVAQRGGTPPMRPSQSSVDRSQFKNTPDSTIYKLAWMVNGEIGSNASPRQQIVQAETALNRAQSRRQSLDHVLLDTQSKYGYYDGRSAHPTYRLSARPTPAQFQAFKQNVWPALMAGSNLSDVGWGPMTGNASAGVARNQFAKGTRGYTYSGGNGESYFREPDVRGRLDNLAPLPSERQIAPGSRASAQAPTQVAENAPSKEQQDFEAQAERIMRAQSRFAPINRGNMLDRMTPEDMMRQRLYPPQIDRLAGQETAVG